MQNDDEIKELLKRSIDASDRTTHAVRSIASYFFIQISSGIIAALVFLICLAFNNVTALQFGSVAAVVIALIGFVAAYVSSSHELSYSRVSGQDFDEDDDETLGRPRQFDPAEMSAEDETLVSTLAGWQRTEWRDAGRPDLSSYDPEEDDWDKWLEQNSNKTPGA